MVDNKAPNGLWQTKPLPQPLPEKGGESFVVEMESVILGLIRGGDNVDN